MMSHLQQNKCFYCDQTSSKYHQCVVVCDYCKALHLSTDLVKGRCPRMTAQTQILPTQTIPCQYCLNAEEQCMSLVHQMMQNMSIVEIQEGSSVHIIECMQCKGKKQLPLMVQCCKDGCPQCGYLKVKPNPAVKHLHMLPKVSEVEQECSICLQTIHKGQAILRMQCNHEFHYLCLGDWLKLDKCHCPYCRHNDLFVEIDADFLNDLKEARMRQIQPKGKRYFVNSNGEIVQGDVQSEIDDDFEGLQNLDDDIQLQDFLFQ